MARPVPDLGPISGAIEALRDRLGRDPVLSAPWRDQADGRWIVFVSRRIAAPDGRFLGIIAASVDLASFEQVFARIAFGPHSAMSLFNRDGLLLTRYPRLVHRFRGTGPIALLRNGREWPVRKELRYVRFLGNAV